MDTLLAVVIVLIIVISAVVLYNRWKRPNGEPAEFSSRERQRPGTSSAANEAVPPPAPQGWGRPEKEADPVIGTGGLEAEDERKRELDDALPATQVSNPPIRERPSGENTAPIRERPIQKPVESAPSPAVAADPVSFSAWYPKESAPDVWLSMRTYVYRAHAATLVAADAARAFGPQSDEYRPVSGEARVPVTEGALVTATPELSGFQFNPPSASVAFYEDWHALEFKLRPTTAALDLAANGRVTFTVESVIVADLPLSIFVTRHPAAGDTPASPTASPYEAIFCSYSHDDAEIVERVERAYRALGLNYLRDVTVLRSGEAWNARLLQFIEQADIFQLFWSEAAAHSPYVEQEWRYALTLARAGNFIRPVYWDKPLPPVPDALRGLHFHYDGSLDDLGYNDGSSG